VDVIDYEELSFGKLLGAGELCDCRADAATPLP
jgi:hypothetical protein